MPEDPTTSPSSHSVERLLTYYQIRKGDFMVKIDLKDAYFTVPIWKKHQTVLRFLWEETVYEFACLPFVGLLGQLDIRLIVYLYDMLIMANPVNPLLPSSQREGLVWWRDNLAAWNGKALVSDSPDFIIETDALGHVHFRHCLFLSIVLFFYLQVLPLQDHSF